MKPALKDVDLAALMCSRICHDLISPIGAISNGLEMMGEEQDTEMREHAAALVATTVAQAAAKLQFARLAFGASGGVGADLSLEEVGAAAQDYFRHLKAELEWQAPPLMVAQDLARLLLNFTLLAGEAIPRGGVVKAVCTQSNGQMILEVQASGSKIYLPAEHQRILVEGGDPEELDARVIQPYYTWLLANGRNSQIRCEADEQELRLKVSVPA